MLTICQSLQYLQAELLQRNFGTESNYIFAFHTLFSGANKMFDNRGNDITRDEYANGYTLFVYDITPELCIGDYKQPLKTGNASIEYQFVTPLEAAINIVVLWETTSSDVCGRYALFFRSKWL